MFAPSLSLFWHGIFSGKKYPAAFYTIKERRALSREVAFASSAYLSEGKFALSSRLLRYFEYINSYVVAKNLSPSDDFPEKNILPPFLKLLYRGKSAQAFWNYFCAKYHLPMRKNVSAFWGDFEEFQPRRLEISDWLGEHANGKILDVGSGAHSYIKVDCALDSSAKALRKNSFAKRKIVFDINKKSRLPFPENSFDTIMLNSILAYAAKPEALLSQCKRVLKADGILLITNAQVSDYHPAKYFEKNEISKIGLGKMLRDTGFGFDDETEGEVLRFCAFPSDK